MRRLLPILLIACAHHAPAKPLEKPTVNAEKLEATLTPWIAAHATDESKAMSGFVLVAQHDRTVYAHAFGYADREHARPADADTSFRLGSVTKQFTAAAILLLQQDGKLSTAAPIKTYLPDYPAVGADITLHQLLTHTSGIPNYTGLPGFVDTMAQPHTVAELLATFDALPLDFAPGSQFEYSNSNYEVLGAIIEKVSGMSYADFMRERVFAPAGMTRTVVGDAEGDADRALGYVPAGDTLAPAPPIDMTVPYAAGAIRSTANDMVRWHRALTGDALLTEASKRELYTPDHGAYAYGWEIQQREGHTVYWHNGDINGFMSEYRRVPDLDLVVVVLANNEGFNPDPVAKAAVTVALGEPLPPYVEPGVLDEAVAARIVGDYQLDDASTTAAKKLGMPDDVLASIATITLSVHRGHLIAKPVGQSAFTLDAASPTEYTAAQFGVTMTATLPDDGPATAIVLAQHGLELRYVPTAR